MAKTIKFNLICDDKPVRTTEDLQNNFSVEDVLDHYNSKLLHRWLEVRGYTKELEAVSAINSSNSLYIVTELIKIFDVATDKDEIEKSVYMFQALEDRKKACATYEKENYETTRVVDDYAANYLKLVNEIIDNPNDIALIKANIASIVKHYPLMLELNHRDLFYKLAPKSLLAIMCLLMNEKTRSYYLPKTKKETTNSYCDLPLTTSFFEWNDQEKAWRNPSNLVSAIRYMLSEFSSSDSDFKLLGVHLKHFYGDTSDSWRNIEPEGKKYMIISIYDSRYNSVRSADQSDDENGFAPDLVNNQFLIVNGIDYKSCTNQGYVYYMEV